MISSGKSGQPETNGNAGDIEQIMLECRMRSSVWEARHRSDAVQGDCSLYLPHQHLGGQVEGGGHNPQPVAHII